jgi:hypothetical protein
MYYTYTQTNISHITAFGVLFMEIMVEFVSIFKDPLLKESKAFCERASRSCFETSKTLCDIIVLRQ